MTTERCYCRRCLIHDDPGGCLVAERAWELGVRGDDPEQDERWARARREVLGS